MINCRRNFLLLIFVLALNNTSHTQIVPYDTLYNQALTPSGNVQLSSEISESGFPTTYSSYGADDFICTDQWTITKVFVLGAFYNGSPNPTSFDVKIYADDNPNGNLPGTQIYYGQNTVTYNGNGGFTVPLDNAVVLAPGHYWISVYASTVLGYADWGWKPSSSSNNYEAVWENPQDGFGTGYTNWTPITTVFQGTTEKDYSFALFGINGVPASNPDPVDNALAVGLDQNLTWSNPANAVSINVLFGTDPENLTSIYSGPPVSTFDQGAMNYSTDYYWRVDENEGTGTATGFTWHFSTIQDPSLMLNENFDEYGFPPSGWSLENSGNPLWNKYYGVSGYGQGTNSVRAKFFLSSIADSVSSMITYTFNTLSAGDTLSFDYAYAATSMYFIDKLEILTSTDDGQNWELLVLLNGGPDGELVTAPYTTFEFVPDANQWGTMKFAVPEGVNKIQFKAISAGGNDLFLDNIRIINPDTGTPVELTSFIAKAADGSVNLNWQTATEKNNKGFEVERKNLGSNENWISLGFVEGNGTTTKTSSYDYTDNNVKKGKYNYRLKQIDFDGSFTYTKTVEADVTTPSHFALEQNYPNPFNPSTQISFTLPVDAGVNITIYNLLGQKVKQLVNKEFNAGDHNVNFDASGLSSGIYIYVLEAKGTGSVNFTATKKMMLLK